MDILTAVVGSKFTMETFLSLAIRVATILVIVYTSALYVDEVCRALYAGVCRARRAADIWACMCLFRLTPSSCS